MGKDDTRISQKFFSHPVPLSSPASDLYFVSFLRSSRIRYPSLLLAPSLYLPSRILSRSRARLALRTPLFRLHPAYTLSRSDALICVCVCCVMGRSRTLERPCPAFERSAPLMSLLFLCLYVTKPSIRDIVTVCLLLPSSTVHGKPHTKVLSPNAELGGHLCQCLSPS